MDKKLLGFHFVLNMLNSNTQRHLVCLHSIMVFSLKTLIMEAKHLLMTSAAIRLLVVVMAKRVFSKKKNTQFV